MKGKIFLTLSIFFGLLFFVLVLFANFYKPKPLTLPDNNNKYDDFEKDSNELILQRSEGWGPCPPGSTCSLDVFLYKSGKLVFKGSTEKEVTLDQKTVNSIVEVIKNSGVLGKNCSGSIIVDYMVEYTINIDGKTKIVTSRDTGCSENFKELNKIINSYYKVDREGGS